ncbi:MAG: hypothetical protein IPL08_13965 [Saprospiraceae bacterium]|nr:hypothetical protein [Saprospiraceae bacterium]
MADEADHFIGVGFVFEGPDYYDTLPRTLDFVLTFGSAELTSNICAPILSRLIVSVDALSLLVIFVSWMQ